MRKIVFVLLFILLVVSAAWAVGRGNGAVKEIFQTDIEGNMDQAVNKLNPLTIASLRSGNYPGSELVVEETLSPGSNYSRSIVSYQSEGNKIYALLTIPNGGPSKKSAIVFNHGYIPPAQYRTTERYGAYVDGFARSGYIVLKADYRGHGSSEGEAVGAYGSNAYTIDVLNALASLKKRKDVDSNHIGMWGHSLGGFITLRAMVVSKDIKVGVIWAGVVGSYADMLNSWRRRNPSTTPFPTFASGGPGWRTMLVAQYGEPEANPKFWDSISATAYLSDIGGPLELHHGSSDESVPILFSQKLEERMKAAGKPVELFEYPGNDHNLSQSFGTAMSRSVAFFDKYLKDQ